MKKRIIIIIAAVCAVLLLLLLAFLLHGNTKVSQERPVSESNAYNFAELLSDLVTACENKDDPSIISEIDADLEAIRISNGNDYLIAKSIADHWRKVFLDPDYRLIIDNCVGSAQELVDSGVPDSRKHALVILGYQLKDGEMQPELIGRLEAAAAAARALPKTIIVCSGGATGDNNPDGHTEAGLMRDYLISECGIDKKRIFIDEDAMTTQENAENTLKILQKKRAHSMTVITSSYHQCWGQADYNAVAAIYAQKNSYDVEIIGNYSYYTEPPTEMYKTGYKIAAIQIAGILQLPDDAMKMMPSMFPPRPVQETQDDGSELVPAA